MHNKSFKKLIAICLVMSMFLTGCDIKFNVDGQKLQDIAQGVMSTIMDGDNADISDTTDADAQIPDADSTEETGSHDNGKPWVNSTIPGLVTFDTPTDPKDDMYLYSCKDWLSDTKIPDGYSSWSRYSEAAKNTTDKAIKLLTGEKLEGHDGELVKTFFDAYVDMDARNALGVEPLKKEADTILALKTLDDITELYTDDYYKDVAPSLFSAGVTRGLSDSDHYYIYLDTVALLLNDSANYFKKDEYGELLLEYGRKRFEYLMDRMGFSSEEAAKHFERAMALETMLAWNTYTNEQMMSADYYEMVNNELTLDELLSLNKTFPMKDILYANDLIYDDKYLVTSVDYIKALDDIYTEENIEEIKSFMLVTLALYRANQLDEDAFNSVMDIYNECFGVSGMRPIEERAYNQIRNQLPQPFAKAYIKKYASEEDKKRVEDMCYEVIDTYREILEENTWASQETIDYAIKKLDKIRVNAGWPDKWDDYSGLDIEGLTYPEICTAISNYKFDLEVGKLGTQPDPDNWAEDYFILDCNAFYDSQYNSINMIIGMMDEPFYYPDMPVEELYASLGAFWIGHEISHAFDSNGAQYDADGNLNNWWTDDDYEQFNTRVKKMDDYLDNILIMDDYYTKGSNVDTEMIADMTGVQCALKMAEKVDGFDYKRFFEYYCQMNASVEAYASQLSMIQGDPHPIDYQRGNVPVQQFDEFYETYDVKEGDNMYLAPEDRLIIW